MRSAELIAAANAFSDLPFDGAGWLPALTRLAALTGSARGQLIGFGGPGGMPFNLVTGLEKDAIDEFIAMGGDRADVNWRIAASNDAAPMEVVSEAHYAAARASLANDLYDEYCDRQDISFGCQTALMEGDRILVGLAVLRTRRDGPTTDEQREVFAALAPHVRTAARTSLLLEQQGAQLVAATLEAMTLAAFVCDGFGTVRAMTPAAEASLSTSPLRLARGALRCSSAADEAALSAALAGAINAPPAAGMSSTLAIGGLERPQLLSVVSLPRRDWNFGFQPRALVIVRGRSDGAPLEPAMLRALYGLTFAEVEIVNSLLAGMSRNAIAAARGVSLGTVQSQMKVIYQKLRVSREAELIVKLSGLRGPV